MSLEWLNESQHHRNSSHYSEKWVYQRRATDKPYAVHFLACGYRDGNGEIVYTVSADIFDEAIPVTNQDTSIRRVHIAEPGMFVALVWETLSRYGIQLTDDDILQLYNAWLDAVAEI